jgi:hypothetical protein
MVGFSSPSFWNWFVASQGFPTLTLIAAVGIKVCWDLLIVSGVILLKEDMFEKKSTLKDILIRFTLRGCVYTIGWFQVWFLKEVLL